MIPGTTYSHRQAKWLGLDPLTSLEQLCTWPLQKIRLAAYWDEIEISPGKYNFSLLKQQLEMCQRAGKQVVLSVGVKAPRWPEFYFPAHVQPDFNSAETTTSLLTFLSATIQALQTFSCITHWQIENEPLDPSGPTNQIIPGEFLEQEVELVRQHSNLPLIINLWGNDLSARGNLTQANEIADVVGLDLYPKQFLKQVLGKNLYRGPFDSPSKLQKIIAKNQKPIWIMELQAEPWEKDDQGYRSAQPGSFNLAQLQKNWELAQNLNVEATFFWGAEYWLWQQSQGNSQYVDWLHSLN